MFVVWLMPNSGTTPPPKYQTLKAALDRAQTEALYGNWERVDVLHKIELEDDRAIINTLVQFNAKEMRDAAKFQREAYSL